MDNITKTQEMILEILEDIDNVCRKNNIKYSLYAGTLLGAVRNKGFIPWDDDGDVVFERSEYDKFIKIYPNVKKKAFYLKTKHWVPKVIKELPTGNPKQFFFVDLLIFDNTPNSSVTHRLQIFALKVLQGMLKEDIKYERYKWLGKAMVFITHMMGKPFTTDWKLKLYNSVSQLANKKQTDKLGVFNTLFAYINCVFPKHIVKSYEDIVFENKKFMALSASDEVLSILYGNYMTLPPEEERVPLHADSL